MFVVRSKSLERLVKPLDRRVAIGTAIGTINGAAGSATAPANRNNAVTRKGTPVGSDGWTREPTDAATAAPR